jgi:POT family proton-dependent oligopeptide transporter
VVGVAIGFFGHIFLVVPALPGVITHKAALAPFLIGMLVLATGAGFIKPSLGPLLCDQSPVKKPTLKTLKSGERVIVDPQTTVQRYFLVFYWCINIGSFWMIVTSYTERLVGFWVAFLCPAIIYLFVPLVFVAAKKRLYFAPPQGSVVLEALYVFRELFRRNGWKALKGGEQVWSKAKPSNILEEDDTIDEKKVFWDDQFVDEIRQSLKACSVSWILVIFYLADGGIGNMENDQSAAMILNHIPNDITGNFNPLSIIIFTPIITYGLYPLFEKIGYPIKATARFSIGFALGTIAMIFGAIVQWKVYQTSPCGWYATDCELGVSRVALAWQIPQIVLPAIGEIFISVTSCKLGHAWCTRESLCQMSLPTCMRPPV